MTRKQCADIIIVLFGGITKMNLGLKDIILELRLYLSKLETYKETMIDKIENSLDINRNWNVIDENRTYNETGFEDYYYDVTYQNNRGDKQLEISRQYFKGELICSNVRKLKVKNSSSVFKR